MLMLKLSILRNECDYLTAFEERVKEARSKTL